MRLSSVPFDGLFIVYRRAENGHMTRLFHGIESGDIPEEYASAEIVRIYPYDESIMVEIK